jgi:hypothetical protein
MKKQLIIAAAFMALFCGSALAQYSETNNLLYHTFRTPQTGDLNAAFFPNKNTFYLRLPSIGLQFGSPVSISDIVRNQGDTLTVIDLNKTLDALRANNRIHFDADINLIGFGFKVHHTFFTFNTRLVTIFNLGIPVSVVDAFSHGNVDASGNAISEIEILNGNLLNTTMYAEIALGGGHYFEPIGLTVGARAKYLYGILNMQTDNTRAVLTTSDNFEQINLDLYYQFQESALVNFDTNGKVTTTMAEMMDIFGGNGGFSFDIGAKYDMGPFTFSLAINDLAAGIHWHKNVNTVTPKNGHVALSFSGEDATTMLHGGKLNTDSLVAYYNDLIKGLQPATGTATEYWYSIPTKINVGASFNFAKMLRAGFLFHGQFDRGLLSKSNKLDLGQDVINTFRFNTTLSFGANLFNWFEFTAGNSFVYDGNKLNFFNPGVGLIFTPATVLQLYIIGDYVSSIYLVEAQSFSFKIGLNLLFGNGGASRILQN